MFVYLLFLEEMQDISEFLLAQVEAIAGPEKWEAAENTYYTEQTDSFETNTFLNEQVPFLWSLLSDEEKDDILQRYGYKGFDSLDADKVIAYHFKNGTAEKMLIEQNSGIQADTFDDVSNMLNAAYNDIYWAINSESIIN